MRRWRPAGDEIEVVLDRTPFYPEGGGQVADRGILRAGAVEAGVTDVRREGSSIVHRVRVGGGTADGVLHFQGKTYPFKAKGVTVGGIGYTKSHAQGDVYFLKNAEDFAGSYSAVTIGAAAGTAGAGGSQYENQKGVYVRVKSKSEGLALNLGLGVVTVEFVK